MIIGSFVMLDSVSAIDENITKENYECDECNFKLKENYGYKQGDYNNLQSGFDKINTTIISNNITVYKNDGKNFNITLQDEYGNKLSNVPIYFSINNTIFNTTTNNEGIAFLDLSMLNCGKYEILTKFDGNNLYLNSCVNNYIFIKSTIFSDNLVKIYKSNDEYYAYFYDFNGNPLINTVNTFKINGAIYSVTTNSKGRASIAINLNVKKYTIETHNLFTDEVVCYNITVLPPIIENSNLIMYYKNDSRFSVRIVGDNGLPVGEGKTVKITINGVTYNYFTNKYGYVSMPINLAPKTYTICAEYNNYKAYNNITVLPTLLTNDLNMKAKDGSEFEAIVLDGQGNPYPNQIVTFTINGVSYSRTSNEYGIAKLPINLKSGTYTIKTTFNSYSKNNNINTKLTSSVVKKSTSLYILNMTNTNFGNVFVQLKYNNLPLPNKSILFDFNGLKYVRLTNSQGYANLNYKLGVGSYNLIVSFSGDNNYKSSTVHGMTYINRTITSLSYDNITTLSGNEVLKFYLSDEYGNALENEEIQINIDNSISYFVTTDVNGCGKLVTNLTTGIHNICATYGGSPYYFSSLNSFSTNILENNLVTYSLIIPNYVELTNKWTVYPDNSVIDYYSSIGQNAIVKMPVSRQLGIITQTEQYFYNIGFPYSDDFTIGHGDYRIINSDDYTLLIQSNRNYVNITYTSYLKNGVNQFSPVYMKKSLWGTEDFDYEEMWIVVNGEAKVSISFTNPILWNENIVHYSFMKDNHINHINSNFNNYENFDTLIFSSTNESVVYSDDFTEIINFPSVEKITTSFSSNGLSVVKDEFVSFGKNYIPLSDIEVVQTYTLTDCLITSEIIEFYLNQQDQYGPFVLSSVYTNFLTGLHTIWEYDQFSNEISKLLNLSVNRENTTMALSGSDYYGNTYVHCPNPTLNLNFLGEDVENIILCRSLSSLLLSEFEAQSLRLRGFDCNSSLYMLFSEMLAGKNFTINITNNILCIKLNDDDSILWLFDLENGIVYDWVILNEFQYKGAISNIGIYCCIDYYKTETVNNIDGELQSMNNSHCYSLELTLPENVKKGLAVGFASLLTGSAAVLILNSLPYLGLMPLIPALAVPLLVGVVLIAGAWALNTYANDGNPNYGLGDTLTDFILGCA